MSEAPPLPEKINILGYGFSAMRDLMTQIGEPSYRAQQVIQWIHQHGKTDFNAMTNLSKSLRTKLIAETIITPPDIEHQYTSADGTVKILIKVDKLNTVETVIIPESGRLTLCVSSQAGCTLNCSFCATGKQGFNRNLTKAEIIGQLWLAKHHLGHNITNVVFMGMGEPLYNYPNVSPALELFIHDSAYGLSKYKVTISTAGIVPIMEQLSKDHPTALAVSLHAANDKLRNELVPINRKYNLSKLLACCQNFFPKGSKRHITFEYVMLANINDSAQDASSLAKVLGNISAKVNLIPFNPFPNTTYTCSSPAQIEKFQAILKQKGLFASIRRSRGDEIAAACGQLQGQISDRTTRSAKFYKPTEKQTKT